MIYIYNRNDKYMNVYEPPSKIYVFWLLGIDGIVFEGPTANNGFARVKIEEQICGRKGRTKRKGLGFRKVKGRGKERMKGSGLCGFLLNKTGMAKVSLTALLFGGAYRCTMLHGVLCTFQTYHIRHTYRVQRIHLQKDVLDIPLLVDSHSWISLSLSLYIYSYIYIYYI